MVDVDPNEDQAYINAIALMRRAKLNRQSSADSERFWARRSYFFESMLKTWGKSIEAYARLVIYAQRFGNDIRPELDAKLGQDSHHLVQVLNLLHGNSLRVAWEVLELAISGYPQGALARWRTMHEIAVTALFIEEHGEDVACRYWIHGAIERHRISNLHEAIWGPLDKVASEEIRADWEAAIDRFGVDFKSQYGWAGNALTKKCPSFRDIEASVRALPVDARWTYKWASIATHPQVWGIVGNLGSPEFIGDGALVGPSAHGLDLPMSSALISLFQCGVALGSLHLADEWAIRLAVMRDLTEWTQEFISGNAEAVGRATRIDLEPL